jgi:hypothetical protein
MTKPGYGTIVEAVALQQPIVYVRRYNFIDEPPLVDYLHRYGRGVELSIDDFTQGHWEHALRKILELPMPTGHPPPTGATDAAKFWQVTVKTLPAAPRAQLSSRVSVCLTSFDLRLSWSHYSPYHGEDSCASVSLTM